MPDHCLERFRQRGDPGRIDLRNDDHYVAVPYRISVVLADDAVYIGGVFLRQLVRADQIGADVALGVAPAERKYLDRVVTIEPARFQPSGEYAVPAFVVGARSQLGNVIDRAIGFDAAQ